MRWLPASFALFLTAGLVVGQEKPPVTPPEPLEAVIIPVKTLSGDSFERLTKLLGVFPARFTSDERLRTIVVYAPKEVVTQMRRVVEQLDQPGSEAAIGRNIEMTLALLRASTVPPAGEARPLPAELEPVAKQLRAATQYKHVQLWDVAPFQIQEGREAHQTSRLPGTLPDIPAAVSIMNLTVVPEAVVRKDTGRYVRFSRFRLNVRVPYPTSSGSFQVMEIGLNTSGDFKEGQKTVLGKVGGTDDNAAIFAVVSLRVLD